MQKVEVLAFEAKSVTAKKGPNAGTVYIIPEAQCVLHGDDGSRKVGVLNLPKDHPAVKPGVYTPTFKLTAGFDGKIFGTIDTLVPVKP